MTRYNRVEGFEALDAQFKALQDLTGSANKAVLRRALVKSGQPIAEGAKANSPWVDTANDSKIRSASTYTDGDGKRTKRREPKHAVYAYVSDPHPLSAIFEYGTNDRYQKNGRYTGKIEPHFYMRGAADDNFDTVVKSQADLIGQEIEKAIARHNKKNGG